MIKLSNNKIIVDQYIEKISKLLPYSIHKKQLVLERLTSDVSESLLDSDGNDPSITFGNPRKVAKDISLAQNWSSKRASYSERSVAYFIDLIIQFFAILFGFMVWLNYIGFNLRNYPDFKPTDELTAVLTFILLFVPYVLFWILGYFILFEKMFNATIGKIILKLMVVDETGIKINWYQSIIRNLSKSQITIVIVETLIGYLQKTNHQRPLDIVAKTIVIKK